jgi:hypothetical protein
MKKITLLAGLFSAFAFLSGCSTVVQNPVIFSSASVTNKSATLGVVQSKVPEFSVNFPGADCLLCIGVAAVAHSKVRDHAKTIDTNEIQTLGDNLVKKMSAKGYSVKKINQNIDLSSLDKISPEKEGYSKYNFSSYARDGIQMLLVIDVKEVGFTRGYQSYFPTGPMKAKIFAEGFLVNTADNKFLWYQRFDMTRGVNGEWDVEPKFPQLTNAYYSMIEEFRDSVIRSLD